MELFSFLFGVVFGSFLNVLIYRLPLNKSIITSSRCPNCNKKIKWYENIPLISYIFLRAKCSSCASKIPFSYFFIELFCGVFTYLLFVKLSFSIEFFAWLILLYTLVVLSFIDLKFKAVPDYLLLIALISSFFATQFDIITALKNAFIFAGFFTLLEFILTFYIQNIKSKLLNDESLKEQKALGEGDLPIVAIIGAILGIKAGIIAIFLSAFFALIPALYLSIRKKEQETPYIPFLVLGFLFEFFIQLSTKVNF